MNALEDLMVRVVAEAYEPSREEMISTRSTFPVSESLKDRRLNDDAWYAVFEEAHVFTVPTRDLIDELSKRIELSAAQRPVELFAGRGLLSAGIRRRGLSIEAFDLEEHEGVTRGNAFDVLKHEDPDLVLFSFVPNGVLVREPNQAYNRFYRALFDSPSLRTIIHLGNHSVTEYIGWTHGFSPEPLVGPDELPLTYPCCADAPRGIYGEARRGDRRDIVLTRAQSPENETSVETA